MFTVPKNPFVIHQREECYMLFKFESFYKHLSFKEVLSHTELNIIIILIPTKKLRERRLEQPIWARNFFASTLAQLSDSKWYYSLWQLSPEGLCSSFKSYLTTLSQPHILLYLFIHGELILNHLIYMLIKQAKSWKKKSLPSHMRQEEKRRETHRLPLIQRCAHSPAACTALT